MKTLEQISKTIEDFVNLSSELEKARKELSLVDADLSNCYHSLEFGNLSGPKMMKIAKFQKEVLIKRRKLKESISLLTSVEAMCTNKSLSTVVSRSNDRVEKYESETQEFLKEFFK